MLMRHDRLQPRMEVTLSETEYMHIQAHVAGADGPSVELEDITESVLHICIIKQPSVIEWRNFNYGVLHFQLASNARN